MYDRPLGAEGLTWGQLVDWWKEISGDDGDRDSQARALFARLRASVSPNSPGERLLIQTYAKRYGAADGYELPALLPQIYMHYDPYTRRELGDGSGALVRQRMDFLLLMNDGARVVLEIDGAQHYSQDGKPSPGLYASMVSEDRQLRLAGYEVYRFGGAELMSEEAGVPLLDAFFDRLLARHGD